MKPLPKNKALTSAAIIIFILGTILFALNQFDLMNGEHIDLSKLKNPRLVAGKKARLLRVYDGDELIKTYPIALGFAPFGDKETEGDGKTPEGDFYVFVKNDRSKYYLSLGISYPSIEDARRGLAENLISAEEHEQIVKAIEEKRMPPQNTRLGGEIYIHGGGIVSDWTQGCIALKNEEMKELFDAVPIGAPVRIDP
jgi:murein L,D-transpeptidase YafK